MSTHVTKPIFFYCVPQGPPENTAYQHAIVCLGEGLKALGVPFYSDVNYWKLTADSEDGPYLFNYNPEITPDDCSVVVLNHSWLAHHKPIPANLFHPRRAYLTVYLDSLDGSKTPSWEPEFREFDIIFRTHYSRKHRYPANFRPWYFGLSNRILQETEQVLPFHDRRRHLLMNFRVNGIPHSVRAYVAKTVIPKLQPILAIDSSTDQFSQPPTDPYTYLQWLQSGRRHYPGYYQRLKETVACACFGGYFVSDWGIDPSSASGRLLKRAIGKLGIKTRSVVQWDSWRLWESLAAGCATFHLDFDKYGFLLPVMPQNWKHYIGVDLDNISATLDRLADEPDCLEKIASQGQQWARQHYSPIATAERFLKTVRA